MMIGGYPCCDGSLWITMPDKTPAYWRELCPHCGAPVWHKLSRADPMSWKEADFLAEFVVDHAAKTIVPRQRETTIILTPEDAAIIEALRDGFVEVIAAEMAKILNGD